MTDVYENGEWLPFLNNNYLISILYKTNTGKLVVI